MTYEDHLIAQSEPVLDSYVCPVSGAIGPAFCFAWLGGTDDRWPEAEFIHADFWIAAEHEREALEAESIGPSWSGDCELANSVRAERRMKLADCDWTQGADSPLAPEAKADWAAYRQALRDLPEVYETAADVIWPGRPG